MRIWVPRVSLSCVVALGLCVPPPLHLLDDNLGKIFPCFSLFLSPFCSLFLVCVETGEEEEGRNQI